MKNKDLQIFVLSFGRAKVPTLKEIKHPESVIVLTSTDNKFKDKIEAHGAKWSGTDTGSPCKKSSDKFGKIEHGT